MKNPTINRLAFLSLMTVSLGGCALLPGHHVSWAKAKPTPTPTSLSWAKARPTPAPTAVSWAKIRRPAPMAAVASRVKVRPAPLPVAAPLAMADDGLYADAVAAVTRRDYASALDLLQAARTRNPDDARVMNAFGVVYDKLGRFDLSPRYYAQAETLDPGSRVVANNRAYSLLIQSKGAAAVTALAQAKPAPAPRAPSAPAAPVRLAAASLARPVAAEYAIATAGADHGD